jgi:hypothetical protein
LRDLTQECIEANPGPANWEDIRTWIILNRVSESHHDLWKTKLDALALLLDVEFRAYAGSHGVPELHAFLDKVEAQPQLAAIFPDPLLGSFRGYIEDYVQGINFPI